MFSIDPDVSVVFGVEQCGSGEWRTRVGSPVEGKGWQARGPFIPATGCLGLQNLGHFGVGTIMDLLSETSDVSPAS